MYGVETRRFKGIKPHFSCNSVICTHRCGKRSIINWYSQTKYRVWGRLYPVPGNSFQFLLRCIRKRPHQRHEEYNSLTAYVDGSCAAISDVESECHERKVAHHSDRLHIAESERKESLSCKGHCGVWLLMLVKPHLPATFWSLESPPEALSRETRVRRAKDHDQ